MSTAVFCSIAQHMKQSQVPASRRGPALFRSDSTQLIRGDLARGGAPETSRATAYAALAECAACFCSVRLRQIAPTISTTITPSTAHTNSPPVP